MRAQNQGNGPLRGLNLLLLLSLISLPWVSAAATPRGPEPFSALGQQADPSLSVAGRLVPGQYVALATAASGQVVGLFVAEGEWVEAGTVLLRLGDPEQLQADLAAAEYELLAAQLALERLDDGTAVELALPYLHYRWGKGANHKLRKTALDCITALRPDDREVHAALVDLLQDPYHGMRSWAAEACGKFDVRPAIQALRKLRDHDWNGGVRGAARKALERMKVKDPPKKKKAA